MEILTITQIIGQKVFVNEKNIIFKYKIYFSGKKFDIIFPILNLQNFEKKQSFENNFHLCLITCH